MLGGDNLILGGLYRFEQFLLIGGLQDESGYVIADGGLGVFKIRIAGQQDDFLIGTVFKYLFCYVKSVRLGHLDVRYDDIGVVLL